MIIIKGKIEKKIFNLNDILRILTKTLIISYLKTNTYFTETYWEISRIVRARHHCITINNNNNHSEMSSFGNAIGLDDIKLREMVLYLPAVDSVLFIQYTYIFAYLKADGRKRIRHIIYIICI